MHDEPAFVKTHGVVGRSQTIAQSQSGRRTSSELGTHVPGQLCHSFGAIKIESRSHTHTQWEAGTGTI